MNHSAKAFSGPIISSAFAFGLAWVVFGCAHGPTYPVFAPAVSSTKSLNSKEEFERALAWRWNLERIGLFCRENSPESIIGRARAKLDPGDWNGELYTEDRAPFSSLSYTARRHDGAVTHFEFWARKGKQAWLIEGGPLTVLRENRLIGYAH